jgi:hypothetical protein
MKFSAYILLQRKKTCWKKSEGADPDYLDNQEEDD